MITTFLHLHLSLLLLLLLSLSTRSASYILPSPSTTSYLSPSQTEHQHKQRFTPFSRRFATPSPKALQTESTPSFSSESTESSRLDEISEHTIQQAIKHLIHSTSNLTPSQIALLPPQSKTLTVLDVNSKTSQLYPSLLAQSSQAGYTLNYIALDPSPKNIYIAEEFTNKIKSDYVSISHNAIAKGGVVSFIQSEFLKTPHQVVKSAAKVEGVNSTFINAVILNDALSSISGSLHDILAHTSAILTNAPSPIFRPFHSSTITISTSTLNSIDDIPSLIDYRSSLHYLPLQLTPYEPTPFSSSSSSSTSQFITSLNHLPTTFLHSILKVRGQVHTGYGRGGKKLGVPTANLPTQVFDESLDIASGVYFGWGCIEKTKTNTNAGSNNSTTSIIRSKDNKNGRGKQFKIVCNIGKSPTFTDSENEYKTIEAHFIDPRKDIVGDFYNETVRIELIGYLRPEIKFDGFASLISQINQDVRLSGESLNDMPYSCFRADRFLVEACKLKPLHGNVTEVNEKLRGGDDDVTNVWVGKGGEGREGGGWSWEREEGLEALKKTPLGKWVV